jgi:hypothetical protein
MESRTMNELRAGPPLVIGGVTIVPLERWIVTVAAHGRGAWGRAEKRAAGVLIADPSGARALDAAGGPLDLDVLKATIANYETLTDSRLTS